MKLKGLLVLLLLANIAFYAWQRFAVTPPGEPLADHPPLAAEKVHLLAETDPGPPAPKPAATPPAPPAAPPKPALCLEWGIFSGEDIPRARAALAGLKLGDKVTERQEDEESGTWWVYIPPQGSSAAAQKKLGEVHALGVEEGYILQENTRWKFAISLGVFKTEEAAKKFLATLQGKGVRSAQAGPRKHGTDRTFFLVRPADEALAAQVNKLKHAFPESRVTSSPCK